MKKINYILGTAAMITAFAFTVIQSVNWKVKEDSYAVKIKGGKVDGSFKGLKAIISFDEANLEHSKIWASVDASSINTGSGMMDKHAMSESALDVKQFPIINFESASISKAATGYEAKGKLTMKGVTKEITLPFSFENKGNEGMFKGSFSVIPKEFNITRGGTPDKIEVELSIPVNK